jgi:hypothetical protein
MGMPAKAGGHDSSKSISRLLENYCLRKELRPAISRTMLELPRLLTFLSELERTGQGCCQRCSYTGWVGSRPAQSVEQEKGCAAKATHPVKLDSREAGRVRI